MIRWCSVMAQNDLLRDDFGRCGDWTVEGVNSIGATTKGTNVCRVYSSCRQPISPQDGDEEQQAKMLGLPTRALYREAESGKSHLLGSRCLTFQKPQPAFSVTLAPRPHRFSVIGRTQTLESGQSGFESQLPAASLTSTAWANHFTPLTLSFPICKIGIIIHAR